MKILVLSAVQLVAINILDSISDYEKRINLLVLRVNDLVLLEVNAEIAILTICRISGHFFHENFTDFDRVFGVSDENGTYYDREMYVLDPKLTLTCNVLRRKAPILYRIGKKYSASSVSREKKYLAL